MAIEQVIGTIPALTEAPNPLTDTPEQFDTKAYPYTVSQNQANEAMILRVGELNTFATQANSLADEVNDAKDATIIAKNEAELARDEAVGAVATLPDGIINDNTVSATDTWSSPKIDEEKQDTLVSGTNIKTIN